MNRSSATAILLLVLSCPQAFPKLFAQESGREATDSNSNPSAQAAAQDTDDGDERTGVSAGKPYLARVQVDTKTPATYGDDVVISVWISPSIGLDLEAVRLHPKGELAELYEDSERVLDQSYTSSKPDSREVAGVPCTTSVQSANPNVPILAVCRLKSIAKGAGRIFNWQAVLMSRERQQYEVEVISGQGTDNSVSYFEFGTVDFVSPMLSVVLGGILGAGLWTLFLPISTPLPPAPVQPIENWGVLRRRVWAVLPQLLLRWCAFIAGFIRSTVLGGATALVLIILAKTTEGLDTPIALQVQDLWGGLLVGIFSAPLAKWIRRKVEKVMSEQETEKATPQTQ